MKPIPVRPIHEGVERITLSNGLEVVLLERPQSPGVSVSLWYDVGARDELPGEIGAAHFLEHMMFKGSARFGPGEIDHRTQALGGSNNAFTGHDATVYWFRLAPERWTEALEMEADRMAGLSLEPDEVDAEREVILEELAMYASDPWDALEQAVLAALWGEHPYGRPILGTTTSLAGIGRAELAGFHSRAYRPDRARLVLAGPFEPKPALEAVEGCFGALKPGAVPRAQAPAAHGPAQEVRLERRSGELARLFFALPTPPSTSPEIAELRLLSGVLGAGRASRLHARLVEQEQSCAFVSVTQGEGSHGSVWSVTAELHAEAQPDVVEAAVREEIARLVSDPPRGAELERMRRQLRADFVFSHEALGDQALAVGGALALGDLELPERSLARALAATTDDLARAAAAYLVGRSGVVGWSLPRDRGRR